MKKTKHTPVAQRHDRILTASGPKLSLLLGGLFLGLLLVSFILRFGINSLWPDQLDPTSGTAGEAIWRAVIEGLNLAGLGKEELSSEPNRWVGVITALLGLVLLLFAVALWSSRMTLRLMAIKSGQSDIFESNHSLILGFGDSALDVVDELIEANFHRKNPCIVILSERPVAEMEEALKAGIGEFGNSRIICRQGSITSALTLKRMGIERARSVVLINPAFAWEERTAKHRGDSAMMMAVMAVVSACFGPLPPMTVRMHYKRNLQLAQNVAKGNLFAFEENELLSKIMVQTSRAPGLSRIYADLAGFQGNEFYSFAVPNRLQEKSFGELAFHFLEPMPLGIRRADGRVQLNPPPHTPLDHGDRLLMLAKDKSQLRWFDAPCIAPRRLARSTKKAKRRPEHYLIYGWNKKTMTIIEEYATYLAEGSVVNLVVPEVTSTIELKFKEAFKLHSHLQMGLGHVSPAALDFPAKLNPERYKSVMILSAEGATPEEIDASTLGLLLKFRRYFQELEEAGKTPTTKMLVEIQQSRNAQLMQSAGLKNLMVSSKILSKIMAQVAEEPEVLEVYEDLFRSEGSEIYLKPVEYYLSELEVEVHFADLVLAAQARGEVCFGVRLLRMEESYAEGYGVYLIPDKSQSFWINPGDQLVVLAEDET